MRALATTWTVAAWEFRRFLRPKSELISALVLFAATLATLAVFTKTEAAPEVTHVALVGIAADDVVQGTQFVFHPAPPDTTIEGASTYLVLDDPWSAHVTFGHHPDDQWYAQLESELAPSLARWRARELGLTADDAQRLTAPLQIDLSAVAARQAAQQQSDLQGPSLLLAGGMLAFMMLGIFVSSAYQFAGITAEKQRRITEQVVSAIGPQTWIDGKILGLSLLALASVSLQMLATLAATALWFGFSDASWPLPPPAALLRSLPLFLPLTLLGFLFWNTFVGAMAATIDDPQTSSRSAFLMLPVLPVVAVFVLIRKADTGLMQALALFPPTASPALMLRSVVADPPLWEFALSIALMLAATFFLRRLAGAIFAHSILLSGREPSFGELCRAVATRRFSR